MHEVECGSCIHGYHMFKDMWNVIIGENLLATVYEREILNSTDRYAIPVLKDVIIGYVPKVLSQICSSFTTRGVAITCVINEAWRYYGETFGIC